MIRIAVRRPKHRLQGVCVLARVTSSSTASQHRLDWAHKAPVHSNISLSISSYFILNSSTSTPSKIVKTKLAQPGIEPG